MDQPVGFREWIVKRLRYLIDLRSQSVAAVEKAMGKSRGYLADALRGEKRLSLESLIEVLEHLEIDPREFFSGLTAEERRWALYPRADESERSAGVADAHASGGSRPAADAGDTRSLILALIRVLEAKGVLDQDDLLSALAKGER
jgi:transcriptional regulator with XRE-family HTH domain